MFDVGCFPTRLFALRFTFHVSRFTATCLTVDGFSGHSVDKHFQFLQASLEFCNFRVFSFRLFLQFAVQALNGG